MCTVLSVLTQKLKNEHTQLVQEELQIRRKQTYSATCAYIQSLKIQLQSITQHVTGPWEIEYLKSHA